MDNLSSISSEVEKRRNRIKPLNERIKKLRELTEQCEVRISVERAKLITEFYRSSLTHIMPVHIHDVYEKYKSLGMPYTMTIHEPPNDERIQYIKDKFADRGFTVSLWGVK